MLLRASQEALCAQEEAYGQETHADTGRGGMGRCGRLFGGRGLLFSRHSVYIRLSGGMPLPPF